MKRGRAETGVALRATPSTATGSDAESLGAAAVSDTDATHATVVGVATMVDVGLLSNVELVDVVDVVAGPEVVDVVALVVDVVVALIVVVVALVVVVVALVVVVVAFVVDVVGPADVVVPASEVVVVLPDGAVVVGVDTPQIVVGTAVSATATESPSPPEIVAPPRRSPAASDNHRCMGHAFRPLSVSGLPVGRPRSFTHSGESPENGGSATHPSRSALLLGPGPSAAGEEPPRHPADDEQPGHDVAHRPSQRRARPSGPEGEA